MNNAKRNDKDIVGIGKPDLNYIDRQLLNEKVIREIT